MADWETLLAPGVTTWPDGDAVILWQGITGRHIRLHPTSLEALAANLTDARLQPLRRRLRAAFMLCNERGPDWPHLVPVRSRLLLYLPDEAVVWLPVPTHRTAGGYGFRGMRLTPTGHAIWQRINDSRTITQISRRCGVDVLSVQAFCAELCRPEVQALQLREEPLSRRDLSLERLVGPPRPDSPRSEDQTGTDGETTLTWYHLHDIVDGSTHFDNRETTVAHAFGKTHPAIDNLTYGERLYDILAKQHPLHDHSRVVEVGCGTGEMAKGWLQRANGGAGSRYLRVDLSPELLRTQAEQAPNSLGTLAHACHLPFPDQSVDVLLSNEVIADLSAALWNADEAPETSLEKEIADRVLKYTLPVAAGRQWYNLGAWKFLEEIHRVLKPGGLAWVSEFGSLDAFPEEATQLDHPEVSIHFGHLTTIAQHLGLVVECQDLATALQVKLTTLQPARHSWMALRALARARDHHLQARAWKPADLAAGGLFPFPIEGVQWVSLADEGPGPLITRFFALTMRRASPS